ncbi:hypothetical protein A2863_03200 [Candidatus Woesebacteria bacterium RIFCSPHIGHO2_01_FULL_38_9b]|uniref:Uncharacterized protein n=1 Tax=Candidatus Woesebacteria bacterium RIFCSPHIGHO2_01_FULL_38_9b TaxID=1802493 RepID=A0A1F7Y3Y4_9BACT|nr:MAG: hypothetical protein A2863_03200 [Candidatus Woesebacteria bacterium RIFCSPHIGHO2_01_FULL_38_9b]
MLKRIKKYHDENVEEKTSQKITFDALKKLKIAYIPYNELLKEGFFAGIGWAAGVTVGFVIISTIIVYLLNSLGGLPLIGGWIANIVEETQQQLIRRTPLFTQ